MESFGTRLANIRKEHNLTQNDIAERLNKTKLERDKTVFDMQREVSDLLTQHHIVHETKGRAKSIYSIYNICSICFQ